MVDDFRDFSRTCAPAFVLALAACSPSPQSPVNTEAHAEELAKQEVFAAISAPCDFERLKALPPPVATDIPPPPPPAGDIPPFEPSLFVELATFTLPSKTVAEQRGKQAALIENPEVRLIGVPHVLIKPGQQTRVALDDHSGPLARPSLHELVVRAIPADGGRVSLELDVALQVPANPAPVVPPERRVRFVSAPSERVPILLDAPIPEWPGQSLLVLLTLYPMREEADLRALFSCKLERRRQAVERANAE